uniref:peptidylprolyl isomerase n=1 Tax=Trichuris muris TaxID=70415 RepID=A0A5S6Q3J0_TRIMR
MFFKNAQAALRTATSMINTLHSELLYLDIKVNGHLLGRLFIEPIGQAADNFLVQVFNFLQNNISSGEVGFVSKVDRLRSVELDWSSNIKNSFQQYCLSRGATSIAIPCPLAQSAIRDLDLTAKEQIAFVGLINDAPDSAVLPRIVVFTSHWGAAAFAGPLVGRIYKGTDLILHISALPANSNKKPLEACSIEEIGTVASGCNLNLRQRDVLLDIFPDSPTSTSVNYWDVMKVMNLVLAIKSSGSLLFRQEKYHMALYRFGKAIRYVNAACSFYRPNKELEAKYLSLVLSCILNSAACKIKLKDFSGALEDCNEAMELDPSNPKAYYRRGQAYHGKLCYERSLFDLFTALRLAPHDKAIKNEIAAVTGAIQVYKKKKLRTQAVNSQE